MKTRIASIMLAFAAILIVATRGHAVPTQDPAKPQEKTERKHKTSLWMKRKLTESQKVLEGMTRGDFAMIETSAKGMQAAGILEAWDRADRPGYKDQVQSFELANDAIIASAQAKNLDGVTLAYSQLTISCVQCHKIVRDKVKE